MVLEDSAYGHHAIYAVTTITTRSLRGHYGHCTVITRLRGHYERLLRGHYAVTASPRGHSSEKMHRINSKVSPETASPKHKRTEHPSSQLANVVKSLPGPAPRLGELSSHANDVTTRRCSDGAQIRICRVELETPEH